MFQHLFRTLFIICIGLTSLGLSAQSKFTISGEVKDAASGEGMIGALVIAKNTTKGQATDVYGFYSITLPTGNYELECSMIGYKTKLISISLQNDQKINFELEEQVIEQKTVVIEANKSRNTQSTEVGKIEMEVEQIKKLPALLGEVDILKTIQLLPGVQSAGEGNAGFYVRGGGADQNLILLDNATVYNASHLFGFFSVFNADAVKNLELTKGGVPANYGTRLSSVLDINLKEGNYREYHAQGGIGLIASRFTVEGPIKKDTASFIISARRTYIDALISPFIKPSSNFKGTGYYFYDLNAKFNYKISKKDHLFLSGYFGRDVFGFKSSKAGFSTRVPWGNATGTFRWNRKISDKLVMNAIATVTDYRFAFEGSQSDISFSLQSGIRDMGAKVQWNYYPNVNHNIKWGGEYTHHTFTPNNVTAQSGDVVFNTGEKTYIYSHEMAAYVLDEFDVTDRLRINAGLRVSHFIHVGPFKRFTPTQTAYGTPTAPIITTYAKGDKVTDYTGFEPRMNVRFTLDKNSSIKTGFMRNYQYVHLTSFSPTSLPTDVWLPSTELVKPQIGMQYSLGYFRNFHNDMFESSVEVYYKDMRNLSEYKDGASPDRTVNNNIDNLLVFGRGYSYGAEFFFKKRTGKLNGWIGYTWAKTMRVFDAINNGNPYPSRWDRRHDISFVASYKISNRVDIGAVFVYGTGNAITLPVARYFVEGRVIDQYGSRNSFRMAPYHRADISCTIYAKPTKTKKNKATGEVKTITKKFKSNWSFSVYNVYNRKNPYFIYFANGGQLQEGTLQVKAYQVSLFPILPSVTWNFEF